MAEHIEDGTELSKNPEIEIKNVEGFSDVFHILVDGNPIIKCHAGLLEDINFCLNKFLRNSLT